MKAVDTVSGRAYPLGLANVDTDTIIPAPFLKTITRTGLGKGAFQAIRAQPGNVFDDPRYAGASIIVAGENFGCGSSREHAPVSIKAAGISAVIAKSFARIFYRNAINIGLPILESKEAAEEIKEKDKIEVNLAKGEIKNISTGKTYQAQPFPEFMQKIIKAGGLINYIKKSRR